MLHLVRRLSTELGISVIMSSHVLEDIARTCDAVVVLREGEVAVTRPIETEGRDAPVSLHVRISGEIAAFTAAIGRQGASVEEAGEDVLVISGPEPGGLPDAVRDAAAESGAGLREMRPAGPSLEDSLLEAMT
jgi:ABC-2 type transport system ATP-binding protein